MRQDVKHPDLKTSIFFLHDLKTSFSSFGRALHSSLCCSQSPPPPLTLNHSPAELQLPVLARPRKQQIGPDPQPHQESEKHSNISGDRQTVADVFGDQGVVGGGRGSSDRRQLQPSKLVGDERRLGVPSKADLLQPSQVGRGPGLDEARVHQQRHEEQRQDDLSDELRAV